MSDDNNVTQLPKGKDPVEQALNKIKEAAVKELNTKVEAKVKKVVDAKKIYLNELNDLQALREELADSREEFNQLFAGI